MEPDPVGVLVFTFSVLLITYAITHITNAILDLIIEWRDSRQNKTNNLDLVASNCVVSLVFSGFLILMAVVLWLEVP